MKDGYLDFDEYIRQGEPAQRERAEAWSVAIALSGRQRVVRPEGATIRQPNGNALGYGNATVIVNIHNGNTRVGNE